VLLLLLLLLFFRFAKGDANDTCAVTPVEQDVSGKDIGPLAESVWLRVVPWSIYKLLSYVNTRWGLKYN